MEIDIEMETKYSPVDGFGECRCCLMKGHHQDILKEHIFNGTSEVFYEIFMETFNLMLSKCRHLSMLICESCVVRLRDANSFRIMVTNNEQLLLNSLDKRNIFENNKPLPASSREIVVKTEHITVKEEPEDIDPENSDYVDSELSDESEYTSSDEVLAKVAEVNKPKRELTDLIKGEAELIARFTRLKKLPTRGTLRHICPDYVRHLEGFEDANEILTPSMIWIPPEPTDADPTPLFTPIKEKAALVTNITALLLYSNITPFKRKVPTGYPCYYCRRVFKDFNELKKHTEKHNKATELPKALNCRGTGPETLIVHADVTDLICTICDQNMQSINELKTHLTKAHSKKFVNEVTDRIVPFIITGESFECVFCSSKYESFGAIDKHMNGHFRNYVCKECGSGYVIKGRLKKHIKNMHVIGNFPCEECGKIFTNESKIKEHIDAVHKRKKRQKCPWCLERFTEYWQRQKHLEEIHGAAQKLFTCNVCNRAFKKKYILMCHMKRSHLDQRDFECHLCDYKSFCRRTLKEHMVKHLGEKSYVCEVCNKAYSRPKTLKEHMRIHNNDRRFVCPVCGQAFVQKCSLKGHMKTHHTEYDMSY